MRHDARDFLFAASAASDANRLTLPILCAAVLVAQMDSSLFNLATRPIGEHFAAGVGVLQWVIDSYNLTYCRALADRRPTRRSSRAQAGFHGWRRRVLGRLADFRACAGDSRPPRRAGAGWARRRAAAAGVARDCLRRLAGPGGARPSARRVDRLQRPGAGDRADARRRVDRRLRLAQRLSDHDPLEPGGIRAGAPRRRGNRRSA